jgi:hypothetical protein|tara:strand:+ start:287 stop:526 length:240 start_codon:yes stop_codon:yes gene_type:complete
MFSTDSEITRRVKNLSEEIESLKKISPELNYIECTVEICERYNIEFESVKKALPKVIKEKIEADAMELNMLKYKTGKIV